MHELFDFLYFYESPNFLLRIEFYGLIFITIFSETYIMRAINFDYLQY